jgi:hypothetical protein
LNENLSVLDTVAFVIRNAAFKIERVLDPGSGIELESEGGIGYAHDALVDFGDLMIQFR